MIFVDTQEYALIFADLAKAATELLELKGNAIAEVEFVSRKDMRELNKRTRGIDKETDVLSFPNLKDISKPFTAENYPFESYEGIVMLGSVVICSEIAAAQAEEYGHSVERENCYLFTHGLMHLLGYDHINEDEREIMRDKEEAVLEACGITR